MPLLSPPRLALFSLIVARTGRGATAAPGLLRRPPRALEATVAVADAPAPSPATAGPTFLSCEAFDLDDNEEACEAAYGGQRCQWVGSCHNCGCILLPQGDGADPPPPATEDPTDAPTDHPTDHPTKAPTKAPTEAPTGAPTDPPTKSPTDQPTDFPTEPPTDAPTEAPTKAPTKAPTEAPTDVPTDQPTDPPTDQPTGFPTDPPTAAPIEEKYYVACGKGSGCTEEDVLVARAAEDHQVRCCSDTFVTGWGKVNGCAVWGESDLDGGCHTTSHAAAAGLCAAAGGRLCTREELSARCTKGTGCGFDHQLVWSGSPAAPGHHVVCGKGAGCAAGDAVVAPDDQPHEVRCCSDTYLSGWTKRGVCDVWAESAFNGRCHHNKSHDEAQSICAAAGGRLCTRGEIEAQCTRGTGCGHDSDMVWASTVG